MQGYKRDLLNHQLTTHYLSLLEHGVYIKLTDLYLSEETHLPSDIKKIHRLIGAKTQDERKAVEVILSDFFEKCDAGWFNSGYDKIISNYQTRQRINQKNAQQPRKQKDNVPLAPSKQTAIQSTTKPNPIASKSLSSSDILNQVVNDSQTIRHQIDSEPLNHKKQRPDNESLANGYQPEFDPIANGYQMAYEAHANGERIDNISQSTQTPKMMENVDIVVEIKPGCSEVPDSVEALTQDMEEVLIFLDEK